MILKILGWFWIVTGGLFLFKPAMLRNRLQRRSIKKLRWIFFGVALAFGSALVSATWGLAGVLPKVIMVCGIIGILKAFFFIKSAASGAVIEWFVNQPLVFFRWWAAGQVLFGILLVAM